MLEIFITYIKLIMITKKEYADAKEFIFHYKENDSDTTKQKIDNMVKHNDAIILIEKYKAQKMNDELLNISPRMFLLLRNIYNDYSDKHSYRKYIYRMADFFKELNLIFIDTDIELLFAIIEKWMEYKIEYEVRNDWAWTITTGRNEKWEHSTTFDWISVKDYSNLIDIINKIEQANSPF